MWPTKTNIFQNEWILINSKWFLVHHSPLSLLSQCCYKCVSTTKGCIRVPFNEMNRLASCSLWLIRRLTLKSTSSLMLIPVWVGSWFHWIQLHTVFNHLRWFYSCYLLKTLARYNRILGQSLKWGLSFITCLAAKIIMFWADSSSFIIFHQHCVWTVFNKK